MCRLRWLLWQIHDNGLQRVALGPDGMIQADGPEYGIARLNRPRFAVGAADANKAAARDHDEDDRIGRAVFVKRGARLEVHGLHLRRNIEQERQSVDALREGFPPLRRHQRAVHLDGYAIDARMPSGQLGFKIGAETTNEHGGIFSFLFLERAKFKHSELKNGWRRRPKYTDSAMTPHPARP